MAGLSSEKLNANDYLLAGAASGFITRSLFQPLDVLKIRFQLQVEPVKTSSPSSKYQGINHAMKCILKEEGVIAFWKGLWPAQLLSVTYGALQFVTFEHTSRYLFSHVEPQMHEEVKPGINFVCGMIAGCIATFGSFPFDTIRTRLVGQSEPKVYRGMFHGLTTMIQTEGPRSLYKGLRPSLLQVAPNAGAQFAFYKFLRELWDKTFTKTKETNALQSSLCGAAAGIGAKTTVYPLDLIKKRIQIQGFEEARKPFGAVPHYSNVLHCLKTILQVEGFLGLYKGLLPSVLKAACTTGSHFLFYEQICHLISHIHKM